MRKKRLNLGLLVEQGNAAGAGAINQRETISPACHPTQGVFETNKNIKSLTPGPDLVETIRRIAEVRKFSQKFTDEVTSSYLAEPELSRSGVINAFTRAAQGLGPIQRIEMERFAGTLLEANL